MTKKVDAMSLWEMLSPSIMFTKISFFPGEALEGFFNLEIDHQEFKVPVNIGEASDPDYDNAIPMYIQETPPGLMDAIAKRVEFPHPEDTDDCDMQISTALLNQINEALPPEYKDDYIVVWTEQPAS